ncbi:MAG: alpha/beta fold hydrolase [Verrucomicrobiota bacterium]
MRLASCLSSLLILLLAGCVIAPAKVTRVMKLGEEDLHGLMTQALVEPDSAKGRLALGHFIEQWIKADRDEQGEVPPPSGREGKVYRVSFKDTSHGAYPLDYFDEISPAADFVVKKMEHHTRPGIGVPLMALRENRGQLAVEAFFPPEAIARPLTAIAKPGKARSGVQDVSIELLCPLLSDSVIVNGRRQPLAADFSMPWAATLSRAGKLNRSRVFDMITPEPKREPRLYLMEPYDPNKEPLIMIHGLISTPLAWANLSNELWADEAIRRRYQIWHYLYNTSAPALYSSRVLRAQLRDVRKLLDPENDDPAMRRSTLLTHSMGGLVGKALAMAPGDAFWKAAFTVPHEEIHLTAEDRLMLNDAFEWQADPTIHRIIFIATPHRGSSFADNPFGRIGSWITKPPSRFQEFFQRVSATNPGVFTAEYAALGRGRLNGVNSLSPRQPTLRILAGLPYTHPVSVHSIIGNRGRRGPLEQSSDGIVPYTSSHVPGVVSELIVPTGHGAFRHPQAVAEVRRILKL